MMRAPYTGKADSQVYTDSATNKADVSAAIPWVTGDMPSKFAFVHYRLKADVNCKADCATDYNAPAADDGAAGGRSTDASVDCDATCEATCVDSCSGLTNALNWLQS